jgi:hypothetical protein
MSLCSRSLEKSAIHFQLHETEIISSAGLIFLTGANRSFEHFDHGGLGHHERGWEGHDL